MLISILLHVLIFFVVVFCFSIPPGQSKPFFVFLGAILQDQDFVFTSQPNSFPATQTMINRLIKADVNTVSWQSRINKPSAWEVSHQNRKIFFKPRLSAAQLLQSETVVRKKSKMESDFNPTLPTYIPLRLYKK